MFEEFDDPTPPVRGPEALLQVRARGRALRRRRQLALATGAGATTALAAVLLLALPGGSAPDESLLPAAPVTSGPVATPTMTPTPPTTTVPSPSRTPVRSPSAAVVSPAPATTSATPTEPPGTEPVELRGADLGATAVGAGRDEAVAAVSASLGEPTDDPALTVDCVEAVEEVVWGDFRLAFDGRDRLVGWSSRSTALTTPSGVTVGTTVARLREVYGDRLRLSPSDTEAGNTYTVEGVDMLGQLDEVGPDGRVTGLRHGACSGP